MSATDKSRIPLGKLGWIVLLAVVAAPLAFFFLVTPPAPTGEPAALAVKLPPSKLAAVGLRENRDWDGLPEMFALWADQAEWKEGFTRFAYWNPGSRSHSYFFEAQRTTSGFRFREIPEPHEADYQWGQDVPDDCPIRFYVRIASAERLTPRLPGERPGNRQPGSERVPIDLQAEKIAPASAPMDAKAEEPRK
jgi:hypothetical protein